MHRIDNSKFLLYIEPTIDQKSKLPVNDNITKVVELALNKSIKGVAHYSDIDDDGSKFRKGGGWKGWHTTDCGQRSSSNDYLLGNGMITNNLCVFYLQYYRNAIPESEMNKVMKLC